MTEEDLVEPEVDLAGQPGPALRAWRGEAALVSALLTVIGDEPVRICFSKGHGEPDITSLEDGGYATFADQLRRDGDEVCALDRLGELATGGCRVLVIAEPTLALSPAEVGALEAFTGGGGRVLALLGPVFAPDAKAFASVGLESFAARHGVRLGDNLVVDPERASDVEGPSVWAASGSSYTSHPITARLGGRLTYWPRTREVAALDRLPPATNVTALVLSGAASWGETDLPTIRGEADLVFDQDRDRKGPLVVAVAVERAGPKPTRLVFMGTGRLVMNYRLAGVVLRDYDIDLVLSAIGWLSERDARAGVGPKPTAGLALSLTERQVDWAFRLFVLLLPLLALGGGALTWIRRRT